MTAAAMPTIFSIWWSMKDWLMIMTHPWLAYMMQTSSNLASDYKWSRCLLQQDTITMNGMCHRPWEHDVITGLGRMYQRMNEI